MPLKIAAISNILSFPLDQQISSVKYNSSVYHRQETQSSIQSLAVQNSNLCCQLTLMCTPPPPLTGDPEFDPGSGSTDQQPAERVGCHRARHRGNGAGQVNAAKDSLTMSRDTGGIYLIRRVESFSICGTSHITLNSSMHEILMWNFTKAMNECVLCGCSKCFYDS